MTDTTTIITLLEEALSHLRERALSASEPEAIQSIMAASNVAAAIKNLKPIKP